MNQTALDLFAKAEKNFGLAMKAIDDLQEMVPAVARYREAEGASVSMRLALRTWKASFLQGEIRQRELAHAAR